MAEIGTIGWIDMTVDDANELQHFYKEVVGWNVEETSMGDYSDFTMLAPVSGEAITGICHARGGNSSMPGGWLIYITVADVEASAAACEANGGEVVVDVRELAGGRFCVIKDPSGATAALYQP